jgi:hypothetical protein
MIANLIPCRELVCLEAVGHFKPFPLADTQIRNTRVNLRPQAATR